MTIIIIIILFFSEKYISFTCALLLSHRVYIGTDLVLCSTEQSCPKSGPGLYPEDCGALLVREATAWGGRGGGGSAHGELWEGELHHSTESIPEAVSSQSMHWGEKSPQV